jgi:hypothetical protein
MSSSLTNAIREVGMGDACVAHTAGLVEWII